MIKLDERKFLHGRPRPCSGRKKIVTRMLKRDLLAIATKHCPCLYAVDHL